MKKIKLSLLITILILSIKSKDLITLSDNKPLIISIPFETKYIHEIPNDSNEDYYNDYGYDYMNDDFTFQDMINDWFYNGIYISIEVGNNDRDLYLFLDVENSDFTIGSCNKINATTFTKLINDYSYFFSNSSTFSTKDEKCPNNIIYNIGKEEFYKKEFKMDKIELKFILEKYYLDKPLCGNIGLNVIDKSSDMLETNFLRQLKNYELISNYIWFLNYKAEQFGNIILGGEPHLFDNKKYFLSQYKTTYSQIKIISKNEKNSPWSFIFNNLYINKTSKLNNKNNDSDNIIYLKDNQAELLIERGLIIGTEEYKNLIDKEFFNDLFYNKTCNNNIVSFNNKVTNKESKYYVYSCERESFQGKDIYYRPIYSKPYFNFPSINFFNKDLNYTFSLLNSNLFITKGRVYFLIIFEYDNKNKIWQLGEPFLSKFKLVFNPDQKTIGFYNPNLPKIENDIYEKNKMGNDNEEIYEKEKFSKQNNLLFYIFSITIIIILLGIIIYLAQKLHKVRKKRPNELDDNYNYTEAEGPIIN